MSTDTQRRPNADDEGISERRRQMLRAAATAAPLVATLPSGAALANASAFQCIAANKDATDAGAVDIAYANGTTTWVTIPAFVQTGMKDAEANCGDTTDTTRGNSQGATRSQSWRSGLSLSMRVPNENASANSGVVPAAAESVTVYRIGDGTSGNPYRYFEYVGDPPPNLPLSESDSNPEEGCPYSNFSPNISSGEGAPGWTPVEVVRVYDVGGSSPPYEDVNEDCGAEPCLLLARGPTVNTNLTALNDSCMTSIAQHHVDQLP